MTDEPAMTLEISIRRKLLDAFAPTQLDVINESHQHHGHQGSPGTGQSHFRVVIAAPALHGLSRLEQHRRINAALSDEFAQGMHALALRVVD